MITLITGEPGAGKTQYAIKTVLDLSQESKRAVYYKRIKGLTLDWTEIEEGSHWNDAPDGSIVLLDEAQNDFRNRTMSSVVPPHVSDLEVHRHRGIDIYLVTQDSSLIDNHVKKLTGEHYHLHTPFKSNAPTVLEFSGVVANPLSKKDDALSKSTFRFDKKIWELYQSATIHTRKKKIPKKIYFIFALLIASVSIGYYAYQKLFVDGLAVPTDEKIKELNNIESSSFADRVNPSLETGKTMTKMEYLMQYVPRLKGRLDTAPAYDEIKSVSSYPRIQCLNSLKKGCKCYTQQATKIAVTESVCLYTVEKGGYFDDSLPDYALNSYGEHYDKDDYYKNLKSSYEIKHEPAIKSEIVVVGKKVSSGRLKYSKARTSVAESD